MPTPGVDVRIVSAPGLSGVPSSTGILFVPGIWERGPTGIAVLCSSLADVVATFGDRTSYSAQSYDYVDAAFSQGVAQMYITRVVGVTPVYGTLSRNDKAGTPLPTLKFDSVYYGAYSSRTKVQIAAGTTSSLFTIVVLFDDVEKERYTDLASPAAAVTALANSAYIRATDLASATVAPNNNPATAAAAALSAGSADHTNAGDTQWVAALVPFNSGLGPGQVAAADRTSAAMHAGLEAHGEAFRRTPLLDGARGDSASTLVSSRTTDSALTGADRTGVLSKWLTIPGLTAGTTRVVQSSALAAGLIAAADAAGSTADAAAGPKRGVASYALGIDGTPFTDAENATLYAAHVNAWKIGPTGRPMLYGFDTISTDTTWRSLTHARLRMRLEWELDAAGNDFVFEKNNPETRGDYKSRLMAVFAVHYQAGDLNGATPEEAYDVDTGPSVNTPTVVAARELKAHCRVTFAEMIVHVVIDVTKSLIAA